MTSRGSSPRNSQGAVFLSPPGGPALLTYRGQCFNDLQGVQPPGAQSLGFLLLFNFSHGLLDPGLSATFDPVNKPIQLVLEGIQVLLLSRLNSGERGGGGDNKSVKNIISLMCRKLGGSRINILL